MMSLTDDKRTDIIDAFNTTSRNLDDILSSNLIKPIPLIPKPRFGFAFVHF